MKFEKKENSDTTEYFINNKPVDENTYTILSNDDSVNTLQHSKKLNTDEYHNSEFNVDDYNSEECICEECQEIRDIIEDIKEMDSEFAFQMLSEYINCIKSDTVTQTMAETYSQLGNSMIKTAARLEIMLESESGLDMQD